MRALVNGVLRFHRIVFWPLMVTRMVYFNGWYWSMRHFFFHLCVCVSFAKAPKKFRLRKIKRFQESVRVQGQYTYAIHRERKKKPTQQKIKYALWMFDVAHNIVLYKKKVFFIHFKRMETNEIVVWLLHTKFIGIMTWCFFYFALSDHLLLSYRLFFWRPCAFIIGQNKKLLFVRNLALIKCNLTHCISFVGFVFKSNITLSHRLDT